MERTIRHLASGAGIEPQSVQSFVTPTGIFISMTTPTGTTTKLQRIVGPASLNLAKVSAINDLSRRFERNACTLSEALHELDRIEQAPLLYGYWVRVIAAFLSSGSFTLFFGGTGWDFLFGGIAGLLAEIVLEWLIRYVPSLLAVLMAALVASFIGAGISGFLHVPMQGSIIIGSVIPLLPGMALTNSIRDLLAGDLLSGVARGAEAFLVTGSIAVAVALALDLSIYFH